MRSTTQITDHNSFHGTTLRSSTVAGFTLTENAYEPDVKLPQHAHTLAYFCFVLQGGFTEQCQRHRRTCGPSTLIFHTPYEPHSDYFHARTRCFSLAIDADGANAERLDSAKIENNAGFSDGLLSNLVKKLYNEFRNMDDLSALVVEGLMLELIGEASREFLGLAKPHPHWLQQARDILHHQFSDGLTLSQIAASVGVHHTHLAREFRRRYRCTVGEYIRRLRVEFACHQLSSSDMPLSQIAQAAGFVDQSHFTRTFKIRTGMSPARYRTTFHVC